MKGLSWRTGAIGNAVWGGVLLRDVLLAAGVSDKDTEGKHVTVHIHAHAHTHAHPFCYTREEQVIVLYIRIN